MRFIKWIFGLILLFLLIWIISRIILTHPRTIVQKSFINWNVVFAPTLTSAQRDSVVNQILKNVNSVSSANPPIAFDSISSYFGNYIYADILSKANGRYFRLQNARGFYCACKDSTLWNLQADLAIGASGGSVPVTTSPKNPTPHASGSVDYLGKNDPVSQPLSQGSLLSGTGRLHYADGASVAPGGFIAVIDTGIDSLLLDRDIQRVIMPFDKLHGSRNFLIGGNAADFVDSNDVRHGTSVASIILNEYHRNDNNRQIPRLMILKALDRSGNGDMFSLSCALSYSATSGAKLINLSAGYYGKPDNVLGHYLQICKINGIPVVAAAGNFEGPRTVAVCDPSLNVATILGHPKLFYPACLSNDTTNFSIISVTGIRDIDSSCHYQNFSPEYVTIGVLNRETETHCCSFTLPFFTDGIGLEGTSFATPVISGRLGQKLISGPRITSYSSFLEGVKAQVSNTGNNKVTRTFIVN